MRFGTFHLIGSPAMAPAPQRFAETLAHIALADELQFHTVWVAEHHFSNYGYSANPLLLIARASTEARHVRFGQAVIVTPFWHPIRLAEDIAITDLLTDGRLEIGFGRGYQPLEFHGLDVNQDDSRAIFEEQFELMRLAWMADDFTFSGQHVNVPTPITVLPRPHQQPHPPIWLAVQSETSLAWAASKGCDVLLTGSGTDWDTLAAWIDGYLAKRQPAPDQPTRAPRVGVLRHVLVTETEQEARQALWQSRWQRAVATRLRRGEEKVKAGRNDLSDWVEESTEDAWWDRVVYGTPDHCIAQLRRQASQGVTDFLAWFDIGGIPAEQVQRSMRLFAAEVMPALEATSATRGTVATSDRR
jgi:alkanesulfonate monooxygenase SsuD/methylene tetrahydromethanopterin reductase-like flavin-dependent oxidoreductase (luciferase family)